MKYRRTWKNTGRVYRKNKVRKIFKTPNFWGNILEEKEKPFLPFLSWTETCFCFFKSMSDWVGCLQNLCTAVPGREIKQTQSFRLSFTFYPYRN